MNDIANAAEVITLAMGDFTASMQEAVAAIDKMNWNKYFFQRCEHGEYGPKCFRCIVERVADERS